MEEMKGLKAKIDEAKQGLKQERIESKKAVNKKFLDDWIENNKKKAKIEEWVQFNNNNTVYIQLSNLYQT